MKYEIIFRELRPVRAVYYVETDSEKGAIQACKAGLIEPSSITNLPETTKEFCEVVSTSITDQECKIVPDGDYRTYDGFVYDYNKSFIASTNFYYINKKMIDKDVIDVFRFNIWVECAHHWKKGDEPIDEIRSKLMLVPGIYLVDNMYKQGSHTIGRYSAGQRMGRCLRVTARGTVDIGSNPEYFCANKWHRSELSFSQKCIQELSLAKKYLSENIVAELSVLSDKPMKVHVMIGSENFAVCSANDFSGQMKDQII